MPTRYLTVVVKDGHTAIAQYGHFDGYPSGKGKEILGILRQDTEQYIAKQLHRCVLLPDAEYRNYFINHMLDEEALAKAHPNFWWEDGAALLKTLLETDLQLTIYSDYSFGYDSIQCEWAYVVDYDIQAFEIYKGWNRSPLAPEERFYANGYQRDGFYPVRMVAQYPLKELPELEEMEDRKWTE